MDNIEIWSIQRSLILGLPILGARARGAFSSASRPIVFLSTRPPFPSVLSHCLYLPSSHTQYASYIIYS